MGIIFLWGSTQDMAAIKYRVKLTESERSRLNEVSLLGASRQSALSSGRWRCSKQMKDFGTVR